MDASRLIFLLNIMIVGVLAFRVDDPHICPIRIGRNMIKSCCTDFYYNSTTQFCQPKCKDGCIRGICITINKCVCTPPLILHNNNECIEPPPKCDNPCINANCTARNTCTCYEGFIHADNFTCIPKCLEGYTRNNESKCDPVCNHCENGKCIAPETCECNEKYSKINDKCEPICERPCVNGICSEPDKCACHIGYETDPLDPYICRPTCKTPCVNASCIATDMCSCHPGYESVNESTCSPICDDCTNGDCIAPKMCICHEGYTLDNGKCKPKCNVCDNGFCSAPNTCKCNEGYRNSEDGNCTPICKSGCVNGVCIAPNRCKCFDGYSSKTKDSIICERDEPSCENCDNGKCVSDNVCFCNENYVMVNGSCTPTCWKPCVNGRCVAPNKCECYDGFIRNDTDAMSCYKPCTCENGECQGGRCICNRGFDLVNDTCVEVKPVDCRSCNSSCPDEACWCNDGRPCYHIENNAEESSAVRLAGLEMGWLLGGCLGILLVTATIIVIGHLWRKRQHCGTQTLANDKYNPSNGSVLFTAPETLRKRNLSINDNNADIDEDDENTEGDPLAPDAIVDHRL